MFCRQEPKEEEDISLRYSSLPPPLICLLLWSRRGWRHCCMYVLKPFVSLIKSNDLVQAYQQAPCSRCLLIGCYVLCPVFPLNNIQFLFYCNSQWLVHLKRCPWGSTKVQVPIHTNQKKSPYILSPYILTQISSLTVSKLCSGCHWYRSITHEDVCSVHAAGTSNCVRIRWCSCSTIPGSCMYMRCLEKTREPKRKHTRVQLKTETHKLLCRKSLQTETHRTTP